MMLRVWSVGSGDKRTGEVPLDRSRCSVSGAGSFRSFRF